MAAFTKRKAKLHIELTNSDQATAHGGQLLIDAFCRRFDLWRRIHDEPALEVRKRTGAGFSPVANVAQLLFTLTSGGGSFGGGQRLGHPPGGMQILGVGKGGGPKTPWSWVRGTAQ